jgi:hypothetical protein
LCASELLSKVLGCILTEEEASYALRKASGVILGYAMEYRAVRVLDQMGFTNIIIADLPTHDIEAEKDGARYFIEVKSTRHSLTREYSAHKIAMMAELDGIHATLAMLPEPKLHETEKILSEPKRMLFKILRYIKLGDREKIDQMLSDHKVARVIAGYKSLVIQYAESKSVKLELGEPIRVETSI